MKIANFKLLGLITLIGVCFFCTGASALKVEPDKDLAGKVNFSTDVIYQIVTDRFFDGNPRNNPPGALYDPTCKELQKYCGGDWQGIIDKINDGYLTDMGVTAIWISPPVENIYAVMNTWYAPEATSYHGYYGRDFKKPNPFFGNFADFSRLIETAHKHNIKVIIDFVANHTSPVREDDPSFGENGRLYDNGRLLGSFSEDRKGLFHHYGTNTDYQSAEDNIYRQLADLADLDQNNPVIDRYFKEAIKVWLDKGIDGIRFDTAKHVAPGWAKSWVESIYSYRPVYMYGEWSFYNEKNYPAAKFANESGMSIIDFGFARAARSVFRDRTESMRDLDAMLTESGKVYENVNDLTTLIDGHDMGRFHEPNADPRKMEQALAFLLTSRGVPIVYYGTEHYMTGSEDPANRQKMTSFSRDTTAYRIIQKLGPLRKSNPAIAYGSTQTRWLSDDVIVYERRFGNNTAVVAINRGSKPVKIADLTTSLPGGVYEDVLDGILEGNQITIGGSGAAAPFTLAPKSVAVWQSTADTKTPVIGHVGPMMAVPGTVITIDGLGFGGAKGSVWFGNTAVTGKRIDQWSDNSIRVAVPRIAAGLYDIRVKTAQGQESNGYGKFEVLTGPQSTVRFVVRQATTAPGESVYLSGNVSELGNRNPERGIGPMFNRIVYQYPTWYFDVNVPANTDIRFKFFKKDKAGNVVWEGGPDHTYRTPSREAGTGTVIVDWQR